MVEYKEQNNNDGIVLSIIIPCFNQGEFILDAISSVEKCREDLYEIIIINDGSTEPLTKKVLASLRNRGYFVIDQSKQGPSKARNIGIEMARGRYILPLDADNKIRPGYITKGIKILDKFPEVGVVYGNSEFFDEKTGIAALPDLDLKILLRENYIDTCAVVRKIVWENCGGYDLNILGHEDWEFWLHAVKKGWKFYHIPEVMFDYRVRLNSRASFGRLPENRRKIIQYICNKHPGLFIPNLADIISEKEFVALSERERAEGYQSQLQAIQIELEKSQSRQQKIQAELERSQAQQQQTQAQLERSQSQLQQTQAQLERSQSQLQETQAQLVHSQSQLQETQAQLEHSQCQLQETQAQLERSQSQQQQTQAQLEHSQCQLQETQAELERSQSQVQLLEQRIAELDQQQPTQKSNLTPSPNFIVPQPIDTYEAWLRVNQWNERSVAHLKSRLEQC
ncbi:MAG: glycosyltransferase, partial [Coleofasciculus sp. C3-bin4]|nr:glycosyltransferase [Coleofasciculus sp. C3-bin4]